MADSTFREAPAGAVLAHLHPQAHALRPVCIRHDAAIHYTGTTFPEGPRAGCELTLRRMECFGMLGLPDTAPSEQGSTLPDLFVDVLDPDGDILQSWPVSRKGFEYLRNKLKFRVEA